LPSTFYEVANQTKTLLGSPLPSNLQQVFGSEHFLSQLPFFLSQPELSGILRGVFRVVMFFACLIRVEKTNGGLGYLPSPSKAVCGLPAQPVLE